MPNAETLRALAKRVGGGETLWPNVWIDALPDAEWVHIAHAAQESLDACAALHKAALGARWMVDRIEEWPDQGEWVVCLSPASDPLVGHGARSKAPSRAWLAAILRALAEDQEGR